MRLTRICKSRVFADILADEWESAAVLVKRTMLGASTRLPGFLLCGGRSLFVQVRDVLDSKQSMPANVRLVTANLVLRHCERSE